MKTFSKFLFLSLTIILFSSVCQNIKAQIQPIIVGKSTICIGSPETYSVTFPSSDPVTDNSKGTDKNILNSGTPIPTILSVEWSVMGGTIISGQGTSEIEVQFEGDDFSLSALVSYDINGFENEIEIDKSDIMGANASSAAGIITGSEIVCAGSNGITYSIPPINAEGYVWSLPNGAYIASGNNTNSITVYFTESAVSGIISVYGYNLCGNGSPSNKLITINRKPSSAGTITGNSTVCPGTNGVVYIVNPINGATGYIWTLPTGVTGSSTTNSITVNIGNNAISGIISVLGTNSCGNGTASTLAVTIGTPANAGIISGKNFVSPSTSNVSYSIASITGATGYNWEVPNGTTITSGVNTNNISVNYLSTATSGIIKVTPVNGCGNGIPSNITVTVGDINVAGAITINPLAATNNYLLFKTNTTNLGIIGSDAKITSGGTATNLGMAVYGNNSLEFSTNSLKRIIVNGDGNVGIGTTTTPSNKLEINQGTDGNSGLRFTQLKSTSTASAGNGKFLSVNTTGDVILTDAGSIGSGWSLTGSTGTNPTTNFIGTTDAQDFVVKTNNTERLRVTSAGNIGIGTTTPLSKVHISGSQGSSDLFRVSNGNSNRGIKIGTVSDVGESSIQAYAVSDENIYEPLLINPHGGNVGIGTTNPLYLLSVKGIIGCGEVRVEDVTNWADFVFKPNYKLRNLGEVEQFIKANNHLPEIPTEKEVKENGINLGEMNAKLLQKVEELTLYMIDQQKQMIDQQNQLNALKEQNAKLAKEMETIKNK